MLFIYLFTLRVKQVNEFEVYIADRRTSAVFDSALSIRYCEVDELTGRTPRAALLGLCLP